MTNGSSAYYDAITGDTRRIRLRAVVDVTDPDLVYEGVTSSGESEFSNSAQLYDKVFDNPTKYMTLEQGRTLLDGTWLIYPDDLTGASLKFMGSILSGSDGTFDPAQWVQLSFSGVSILQACSVYFPDNDYDGVPDTFTVEVLRGGTAYYTQTFTGNTEASVSLDGFTVNNPDAIRVTVSKWSAPLRRLRMVEIVPGIYETWDGGRLSAFKITQQANFANTALPYGTCTMSIDNQNRRFDPRHKGGLFQSLEARQGVETFIGVEMPDGTIEWTPTGVYYQYSNGWKTGNNDLTIQWSLVDIIGLLAGRQYLPPDTLPTTLEEWVSSIVGQLGVNFESRYTIDSDYAALSVTANSVDEVSGKSCGELLRMVCMATGTFPRADNETGYLAVEPLWSEGAKMTLDNMTTYPTIQANDDVASIIFTLANGAATEYVVSGTTTASSNTVQIKNPFIHTQEQALTAAKMILSTYGGNQISTTGRGNPASEIGDVDTVWLGDGAEAIGRRMYQTFSFQSGVLQGCQSTLLQADGSSLFEDTEIITESGTWTAPAGITQLRIIVVGGGSGGTDGTDGSYAEDGEAGIDGAGGYVFAQTININESQQFDVSIGAGGEAGQDGTATTFGQYSSADGQIFENGYTDVSGGNAYARTGVSGPQPNTGDGGAGGAGGLRGNRKSGSTGSRPTAGTAGQAGASGCVVVYWEKVSA